MKEKRIKLKISAIDGEGEELGFLGISLLPLNGVIKPTLYITRLNNKAGEERELCVQIRKKGNWVRLNQVVGMLGLGFYK